MTVKVVVPDPAELDWEGGWDADTAYVAGDLVYRDGSTWRALRATTGNDPIDSPLDWELVARKGDPGPKGDQGDQGDPAVGQSVELDILDPIEVIEDGETRYLWIAPHGLESYPSITTLDTEGRRIYGRESYVDANTVHVSFSAYIPGRIILN